MEVGGETLTAAAALNKAKKKKKKKEVKRQRRVYSLKLCFVVSAFSSPLFISAK